MPISLPDDLVKDIRQPIVGDSFGWYAIEPAAAKRLDQPNPAVLVQGVVSTVARGAKCDEVIGFVISDDGLFKATKHPRMINMVDYQIISGSTELALKTIAPKNKLLIARKTLLLPSDVLKLLNSLWYTLFTTFILSGSIALKSLRAKTIAPSFNVHPIVFFTGFGNTWVAKQLAGRSRLETSRASTASLILVVFHAFRIPLYGGKI